MKFQRSSGGAIKEEDASVVGRALLKIASAHKVGDFRALTPKLVVEEVLADENHPLRPYFQWDLKKAAYAAWLHRAEVLIRSVRIVESNIKPMKPRSMFVAVRDVRTEDNKGQGVSHGRMRVLAPDAAQHDEMYLRALDEKITRTEQALACAEEWLERGSAPYPRVQLLKELRAVFKKAA